MLVGEDPSPCLIMPQLRIVPENLHDLATLTATGTSVAGFDATNTQNTLRGRTLRVSGSSFVIKGTLPATCSASHFSMFRHTLTTGQTVALELFSSASWTGSVYDSGALDADCFTDDSNDFDFGLGAAFVRRNIPFAHWFNATEFQSYTATFAGVSSPEIGRVFLGLAKEFTHNPDYGAPLGFQDNTDSGRTLGGSLRNNAGEQWAKLSLDLSCVLESERQFLLDFTDRNGTHKDFVLSLFPEDETLMEAAYTLNAKFTDLDPIGRQISRLTKRLTMQEC